MTAMAGVRAKGAGALVLLWALVCVGGLGLLWRYKATPGDPGDPPTTWPEVGLVRASDAPTLIMVAHPRCACTRASLGELELVMRRAPASVAAYLLFVLPDGAGTDWEDGELYRRARAIPGLRVVVDRGGVIAGRLRVAVSGHVLVYDVAGALRYSGGIAGVIALLTGGVADGESSHVFGCSIEGPS